MKGPIAGSAWSRDTVSWLQLSNRNLHPPQDDSRGPHILPAVRSSRRRNAEGRGEDTAGGKSGDKFCSRGPGALRGPPPPCFAWSPSPAVRGRITRRHAAASL